MPATTFKVTATVTCGSCDARYDEECPVVFSLFESEHDEDEVTLFAEVSPVCQVCGEEVDHDPDERPAEEAVRVPARADTHLTPPSAPEQLPVAVYGTLRSGGGNDRIWATSAWSGGLATVNGYKLTGNGHFPYATEAEGETSVVELIDVDPDAWAHIIMRFDGLEGHPNHYRRTRVTAHTPDGLQDAWMYVGQHGEGPQAVPGNDWANVVDLAGRLAARPA